MTRYADPGRCPGCRSALVPGSERCPRCELQLGGPVAAELFATLVRADALLTQLREHDEAAVRPRSAAGADAAGAEVVAAGPGARLRSASVPTILLGLGALCLLVAALVFLVVTWSLLGVGTRTAILLGTTGVTAGIAGWSAARGLRAATEAFGAVSIGLLVLDLLGARRAGWLGAPSDAGFAIVLGAALLLWCLAATLVLARLRAGGLVVGQLGAVVGTLLVWGGLAAQPLGDPAPRALAALLVTAGLAAAVQALGQPVRAVALGSAGVAALAWCWLVVAALSALGDDPSLASVWGRLDGWPLLAAAVLAGLPALLRPLRIAARVLAWGAALLAVALIVVAPALDDGATVATAAGVGVMLVAALHLAVVPRPWALGALGVATIAGLALALVVATLGGLALAAYLGAPAEPWAGRPGGSFPSVDSADLPHPGVLPVAVLALGMAGWAAFRAVGVGRTVPARSAVGSLLGATAVAALATLVLLEAPVWTVLAALLGVLALGVARRLRVPTPGPGRSAHLAAAAVGGAGAAAVLLGLYDEVLSLAALSATSVAAAAVHGRDRSPLAATVAGALVPPLLAGALWTVGALVAASRPITALLTLLALALVALVRDYVPTVVGSPTAVAALEFGAAASAVPVAVAGAAAAAPAPEGPSAVTWVAVYLTVAGVAACTMAALRPDRRAVAWIGGLLLAEASWVRLAELSVDVPEPYTLPSATALLVVGLLWLRRERGVSTVRALGAGLTLAIAPSLVWVLRAPLTPRALVLGLALLALVVAGVRVRWSAPLLAGAAGGLVLVVREALPVVADAVPRWALIALAGAVLIGLGVTWERRLRQARAASAYLRALR